MGNGTNVTKASNREAMGLVEDVDDAGSDEEPFDGLAPLHVDDFRHMRETRPGHQRSLLSKLRAVTGARLQSPHIRWLLAAVLVALAVFTWSRFPSKPPPPTPPPARPHPPSSGRPSSPALSLQKPEGVKIVGLVFYGRRNRSSILDCYLKRNLVSNGGWLDEVAWGVNTDNAEDLAYLDRILLTTPHYRKIELKKRNYIELWRHSIEKGNIYVKIDDDIVFIEDSTIPLMVNSLLTNNEAMMVLSNIVNSPKMSWLQFRTGTILPYLPEIEDRSDQLSTAKNPRWRASDLPTWIEPRRFKDPEKIEDWYEYIRGLMSRKDPSNEGTDHLPNHRWLPVAGPAAITKTPIMHTEFRTGGKALFNWAIAAQQHYTFFSHLENDRLHMYRLFHGTGEDTDGLWDHTGERISINLIAIRGQLILDNLQKMADHGSDDEQYLTEVLPKQINKRLYIHTKALAAHYSFNRQQGLDNTDVLARYRAYAVEKICPTSFVDPEG